MLLLCAVVVAVGVEGVAGLRLRGRPTLSIVRCYIRAGVVFLNVD